MGVRLAHARAKDPRWLTTLSGSPPPPFDDGLDLPWCALCLRRENDEEDGESLTLGDTTTCAAGTALGPAIALTLKGDDPQGSPLEITSSLRTAWRQNLRFVKQILFYGCTEYMGVILFCWMVN